MGIGVRDIQSGKKSAAGLKIRKDFGICLSATWMLCELESAPTPWPCSWSLLKAKAAFTSHVLSFSSAFANFVISITCYCFLTKCNAGSVAQEIGADGEASRRALNLMGFPGQKASPMDFRLALFG